VGASIAEWNNQAGQIGLTAPVAARSLGFSS